MLFAGNAQLEEIGIPPSETTVVSLLFQNFVPSRHRALGIRLAIGRHGPQIPSWNPPFADDIEKEW